MILPDSGRGRMYRGRNKPQKDLTTQTPLGNITTMKRFLLLVTAAVLCGGCKDSDTAQFQARGKKHRITLYGSDGVVIKKWESTGGVSNEAQSDGWYFMDAATGKLVEVAGTLIIESE